MSGYITTAVPVAIGCSTCDARFECELEVDLIAASEQPQQLPADLVRGAIEAAALEGWLSDDRHIWCPECKHKVFSGELACGNSQPGTASEVFHDLAATLRMRREGKKERGR